MNASGSFIVFLIEHVKTILVLWSLILFVLFKATSCQLYDEQMPQNAVKSLKVKVRR